MFATKIQYLFNFHNKYKIKFYKRSKVKIYLEIFRILKKFRELKNK